MVRIFDGNLCARGPVSGPAHIVGRNIESARYQLQWQAIGVPRAGRNRPLPSRFPKAAKDRPGFQNIVDTYRPILLMSPNTARVSKTF